MRRAAVGLGVARIAIGVGIAAKPALLSRLLGVDATTATRTGWATRMVAAREVALGAGTLASVRSGGDLVPWFIAQAVADGGDALAVGAAIRARHVRRVVGALVLLAGVGGAVGGGYGAVLAGSGRGSRGG